MLYIYTLYATHTHVYIYYIYIYIYMYTHIFTTCLAAFHLKQPPNCQSVFIPHPKKTPVSSVRRASSRHSWPTVKFWTKFGTKKTRTNQGKMSQLVECFWLTAGIRYSHHLVSQADPPTPVSAPPT